MTGPETSRPVRGTPPAGPVERISAAGYPLARRALFGIGGGDAESAHEATVRMVSWLNRPGPLRQLAGMVAGRRGDAVELAGLRFPGPVGLAAGMDKAAAAVPAWGRLGFSHVELGTVTARPQPGNERPRVFRLPTSRAVINRMGFNNPGADAVAARLAGFGIRRGGGEAGLVVGVSIGKSKVTPLADAVGDYLHSLRAVAPHADYVAINVSSPNTPGLRSLQDRGQLAELTRELVAESWRLDPQRPVPIMVKLAPDLESDAVTEAVDVCESAGIAGLIATNTTIGRRGVSVIDRERAAETGGLSGAPLTRRAWQFVTDLVERTELPVIGVGGIMTAADADALFEAGARLVQVYTGLVYGGPALVSAINRRHRSEGSHR